MVLPRLQKNYNEILLKYDAIIKDKLTWTKGILEDKIQSQTKTTKTKLRIENLKMSQNK